MIRCASRGTPHKFSLMAPNWKLPLELVCVQNQSKYQSLSLQRLSAILAAVNIIVKKNIRSQKITILSDSQAAIKALDSGMINSNAVYVYRRCLNKFANRYDVCVCVGPIHKDITGNFRADELVRRGTTSEL